MADILTKDQILGASDLTVETVEIPEWGGSVLVRSLTGEERDQFESSMFQGRGKNRRENLANLRARLVALCVVTEDGKRMFSDSDISRIGQKSASALNRIFDVAQELSGLKAEDIDEMTKNSEAIKTDDSILD